MSRKADAARHCLRHCLHHGRDDHREPVSDAPRQLLRREKATVSPLRRLVAQAALSAARECQGGHPGGCDDFHTYLPSGLETTGTVSVSRREKGPQVAAFALAPASRSSSLSVSPHPSPVPVATATASQLSRRGSDALRRCVCNRVDRGRRSTPKTLTGYDSPRDKTSPPQHGASCPDSLTFNSSASVSRFAQWQSRKSSRTSGLLASGIPVRLRLHACIPLSRGYDRIHGSEESACCANARAKKRMPEPEPGPAQSETDSKN